LQTVADVSYLSKDVQPAQAKTLQKNEVRVELESKPNNSEPD
jgi:hypothetical protein